MSGHTDKIKTRCPVCRAKYRVPANAVGQKARCSKCRTRFVVAETEHATRLPTEEDILAWLNEGRDADEAPPPRVVRAASVSPHATRKDQPQADRRSGSGWPGSSEAPGSKPASQLGDVPLRPAREDLKLRKTG